MHTCEYLHTHDAGAELLIGDVQRVSVSVEPPGCPVFTRPVPAFQMRHLPGLTQTALFSPFDTPSTAFVSDTQHLSQSVFCIYQGFMGGVELLQDLVHDGVGEIGNHRQLHFSAGD